MNEETKTTIQTGRRFRVVLAGGGGHLGRILARHFHSLGHDVTVLARTPATTPWRMLAWDGIHLDRWATEVEGKDLIINLAGRSVDCRYHLWNRREILESRIGPTKTLGEVIGRLAAPPKVWMNASTATIYRHSLDQAMDEENGEIGWNEPGVPPAWRFSVDVANQWEETFFAANTPGTRKIALRSAMVMSAEDGGAFEKLLRLVRLGLGGAAGSGEQFVSWVHEMDFVRAVEFLAASEEMDGVVNIAAPCPLVNRDFMAALREAWGRSFGLNATERMLEFGALFLRTETELILKSRRVVPGRLLERGFRFEFPEWPAAARELVGRWRERKATGSKDGRQRPFGAQGKQAAALQGRS
jgi:uncharacterized protein (TIGR01777 family)